MQQLWSNSDVPINVVVLLVVCSNLAPALCGPVCILSIVSRQSLAPSAIARTFS